MIRFKKLSSSAIKPENQHSGDAGFDIFSDVRITINPMERVVVSTGICVEIPEGYYGRVAPRSGLAVKNGIDVLAGVVDSNYRGELGVVLINLNLPISLFNKSKRNAAIENMFGQKNKVDINPGDRIAQLIIEKCYTPEWVEVESFSSSERNEEGFGSTGL